MAKPAPSSSPARLSLANISLSNDPNITGWYSNPTISPSSHDLLSSALLQAKSFLEATLKPGEYQKLLAPSPPGQVGSNSFNTIADVQDLLGEAQRAYEHRTGLVPEPLHSPPPLAGSAAHSVHCQSNKSCMKARTWLTGLSGKIIYYGNIFDVMVQHHPEYVSLAWGTFKLLFVAILNHAEIASKLSKSISQVADLLPQHFLLLILYPTPLMQEAVARLYARIMKFFRAAITWYKSCKLVHAFKAVFQPWDLSFHVHYEAIATESERIKEMANVASKAELRDTHLQVIRGRRDWEDAINEMRILRTENQRLAGLVEAKFDQVNTVILSLHQEVRLDLTAQRATMNRVHLNQMLSLPLWGRLPTSGESLNYSQSMRKRRRLWNPLMLPKIENLEHWASEPKTALLVMETNLPVNAKIFMLDMIDLIRSHDLPVIWALRYADYWQRSMTVVDLVRMLVLQAMQISADRLLEGSFPVTVEHLRDASTLGDWVVILDRLIANTARAFIVLDAELLSHATANERSQAHELVEVLRLRLSCTAKIIASSSSFSRGYVEELSASNECVKLQTDGVRDWRKTRKLRHPPPRSRGSRR